MDERLAQKGDTILVASHSLTARIDQVKRPWNIGITLGNSRGFARSMIDELNKNSNQCAGDNQPSQVMAAGDCTIPVRGEGSNLRSVLPEIRQDLLADDPSVQGWNMLLSELFRKVERSQTKWQVTD